MAEPAQAAAPGTTGSVKHQRKVRNFLINKTYQLRFTATIVGISAVLTGGLGAWIIRQAKESSRLVNVRAMDPTDEFAQQLVTQFAENDRIMVAVLVLFGLVLSVVMAVYGIIITHKVAGPLFKVTLYLDRMAEGKLGKVYNLRKGDQLVDFFEHFREAHDALRAGVETDIALLDKAIAAVGSTPLGDELREAKARKEESLR